MSADPLCVGVCMMDWDAGVCLGCGRTAAEIDGSVAADSPAAASPAPVPEAPPVAPAPGSAAAPATGAAGNPDE